MRTVEVLKEPKLLLTVRFPDGREITIDGRVATLIESILEDRETLEHMDMGDLVFNIGQDSFVAEIRVVRRRRKTARRQHAA